MAQTSGYVFRSDAAQAGQIYDIRPCTVMSFAAEAALDFGAPVMRGANPETQVVLSDASVFLGVAVFTHAKEQALAGGGSYAIGDAVSVMTDGAVWVTSAVDSVVAGTAAYVTPAGAYTNTAGGGSNIEVGTFLTGGDTGELVALELA